MKLAFYCGGQPLSFVERAILERTNGHYCHVELVFNDGRTYSSNLTDHGTRYTDGKFLPNPAWELVDLGPLPEADVLAFCDEEAGKPYDLAGVINFMFDRQEKVTNSAWFCSEVCVAALAELSLFTFLVPSRTSPQELYIAAKARAEALGL